MTYYYNLELVFAGGDNGITAASLLSRMFYLTKGFGVGLISQSYTHIHLALVNIYFLMSSGRKCGVIYFYLHSFFFFILTISFSAPSLIPVTRATELCDDLGVLFTFSGRKSQERENSFCSLYHGTNLF